MQNIEEGLTLNNTMFNNLPILLKDQTYSQNFVTQSIALFKYHWYIAEDKSLLALIFIAEVMAYNATCERKFPFAFSAFHLHIRRIYQKIKREISYWACLKDCRNVVLKTFPFALSETFTLKRFGLRVSSYINNKCKGLRCESKQIILPCKVYGKQ